MALILSAGSVLSFVDRQILNLLLEKIRIDLSLTDAGASLLVGAAFALLYVGALVAVLTDDVFADPKQLRYSMVTLAVLAGLSGSLLIALAGRSYRRLVGADQSRSVAAIA